MARVIGPTPPGLGLTKAATSQTSLATSPATTDFPVDSSTTRDTPTSSTVAPGLTMSREMTPATPAAATTMSAWRTSPARSRVPVWHRVTVAFSDRRVRISPRGRPTVSPRPTTTTLAPAIGTAYRRSSSRHPTGVHGRGAGCPSTSHPRFMGCSPSTSLAGSTADRITFSSRPVGCWTMSPVHAGSSLSSRTTASTSSCEVPAGRSRRRLVIPISAQSRCLAPTYHWLAGVVADEHRPQARNHPSGRESPDPGLELVLDRAENRPAVQRGRPHPPDCSTRAVTARPTTWSSGLRAGAGPGGPARGPARGTTARPAGRRAPTRGRRRRCP